VVEHEISNADIRLQQHDSHPKESLSSPGRSSPSPPDIRYTHASIPNRLDKMLASRFIRPTGLPRVWRRLESTYQPPVPPKSSRHGSFYRAFGTPVIKNFLIALCTFQAIYWSWLKLESVEMKKKGNHEIRLVEGELRHLTKDEE
jgi:hypothetical protein